MSFDGNRSGSGQGSGQGPQQGGQRPYPQSYNDPSFGQAVKPSSNRTLYWILGIVSAVTIGGAIVCCGGGYFLILFTTSELAKQFRGPVQNSPEVVEHIGEIEDMTLSFQAMQAAGEQGKLVFEVTGTKSSGQVVVDTSKMEDDPENAYELVLADGTRIPMTSVELGAQNLDDEGIQMDDPSKLPTGEEADPAGDAIPETVESTEPAVLQ